MRTEDFVLAHSPGKKFSVEWYPQHVEVKVVEAFSSEVMKQLLAAVYGDARIERISAMLADMSECPSYELDPSDAHISVAYQRSAKSYTRITRSATVTTNERQIRDVRKFAELMAPLGRDVRIFDTLEEARKWLGVEGDVVDKRT